MTFLIITGYLRLDIKIKKKFVHQSMKIRDVRNFSSSRALSFSLSWIFLFLSLSKVSLRRSRRLLFSRAFRKKVSRHALKSRKVQSKPVLGGLRGRKRRRQRLKFREPRAATPLHVFSDTPFFSIRFSCYPPASWNFYVSFCSL